MDYIEDDFTDDAVCRKLPSTWYTLIGARRRDNSQGS